MTFTSAILLPENTEIVKLRRDVAALEIPEGHRVVVDPNGRLVVEPNVAKVPVEGEAHAAWVVAVLGWATEDHFDAAYRPLDRSLSITSGTHLHAMAIEIDAPIERLARWLAVVHEGQPVSEWIDLGREHGIWDDEGVDRVHRFATERGFAALEEDARETLAIALAEDGE